MRKDGSETGLSSIKVLQQVTNSARTQARPFPSLASSLAVSSRGHWGALVSQWPSLPSPLLNAMVWRLAWGSLGTECPPWLRLALGVSPNLPAPRLLYLQDGHIASCPASHLGQV